ncbi:NnrS family protein [Aliiroseovarius sp. KMU-50]|uniref:NnrS family protein n=1 Tax=Aliiroseovarius salicola TaxID=3009082 RepID=A0ABT4W1S2_9RHOB|nr:NnrS family protein [Aliiroseovarius sp. KMU-50]MDA5093767.1 NnrS family protein [Aliiroseovarius sp. KMU-50]
MSDARKKPAQNSSSRVRNWSGPSVLSFGYRPFFLVASVWALLAMALWLLALAGVPVLGSRFDPITWHAHEMLFGYLGAALAGFMLTAVPNWTGRLPVLGWPLAGLVAIWGAGRLAVATSSLMSPYLTAAADVAFPLALFVLILREVAAGRSWKNLPLLALFGFFILGNMLFHVDAAQGRFAANGVGMRLGVATAIMLISLVGGRVIPSFTRNWLVKAGRAALPAAFGIIDKLVLISTALALFIWTVFPSSPLISELFILVGMGQLVRLMRWRSWAVRQEPLLWVLHAGYLFVPLGFLALGLSGLSTGLVPFLGALHLWMAGGIGIMTLAIISRASLAHAGKPLHASPRLAMAYNLVLLSVLLRFLAAYPVGNGWAAHISAILWLAGYALFTWHFWPIWMAKPVARRF